MTSNRSDEHLDHGGRERLLQLLAIWNPFATRDNTMRLFEAARDGLTTESAEALSLWLDQMAMQLVVHGMVLDGVLEMTYRESAPNAAGVSHPEYVLSDGLGCEMSR